MGVPVHHKHHIARFDARTRTTGRLVRRRHRGQEPVSSRLRLELDQAREQLDQTRRVVERGPWRHRCSSSSSTSVIGVDSWRSMAPFSTPSRLTLPSRRNDRSINASLPAPGGAGWNHPMPPKASGRSVSASIVGRLRAALASGRAFTYGELARDATCTERTVRNYLDLAEPALGMAIARERGPDRVVRVRAASSDDQSTIESLARNLAQMLRTLFR